MDQTRVGSVSAAAGVLLSAVEAWDPAPSIEATNHAVNAALETLDGTTREQLVRGSLALVHTLVATVARDQSRDSDQVVADLRKVIEGGPNWP
jgi:2-phospho-L-lactate guanylyltransferase (CobY/MobA/RfbA family)